MGMVFFHSLPIPELWEWIFFIPFPFPNFGNRFFHSLPIPEFWECFFFIPFPFPNWGNGFFQFPSRSRTSGMELSIPVPVPELPNVIPAHPCLIHIFQKLMSYNHLNHLTTKTNNQTNIDKTLCDKRVTEFSTFRQSLGSWQFCRFHLSILIEKPRIENQILLNQWIFVVN